MGLENNKIAKVAAAVLAGLVAAKDVSPARADAGARQIERDVIADELVQRARKEYEELTRQLDDLQTHSLGESQQIEAEQERGTKYRQSVKEIREKDVEYKTAVTQYRQLHMEILNRFMAADFAERGRLINDSRSDPSDQAKVVSDVLVKDLISRIREIEKGVRDIKDRHLDNDAYPITQRFNVQNLATLAHIRDLIKEFLAFKDREECVRAVLQELFSRSPKVFEPDDSIDDKSEDDSSVNTRQL